MAEEEKNNIPEQNSGKSTPKPESLNEGQKIDWSIPDIGKLSNQDPEIRKGIVYETRPVIPPTTTEGAGSGTSEKQDQ